MTTTTLEKPEAGVTQEATSVYFVSLGCPKNLVDSQVMLGLLKSNRFTITEDPAEADTVIVNVSTFVATPGVVPPVSVNVTVTVIGPPA